MAGEYPVAVLLTSWLLVLPWFQAGGTAVRLSVDGAVQGRMAG
ncbi:hypothetical protein MPS_4513 [Mycobacterium pseudoshottsii JCM 15466]|nr:hypothetical protein MPS_4513 [Mycobacterium pseudoshottsii JCM 15466]